MPTAKLWIPALLVVGIAYAASAQRPAPADERTEKPSATKAADKDDDDDDDDQEKPKRSPLETFMRKKLDASSLILEGLCQEDAELIKQGADQLSAMSKVEVWNVLTDPDTANTAASSAITLPASPKLPPPETSTKPPSAGLMSRCPAWSATTTCEANARTSRKTTSSRTVQGTFTDSRRWEQPPI